MKKEPIVSTDLDVKKSKFSFLFTLFSEENNLSMMRFLCFVTCLTGIFVTVMAVKKMMLATNPIEIGGNLVGLILGLFGLAITGKFTQKMFEKKDEE